MKNDGLMKILMWKVNGGKKMTEKLNDLKLDKTSANTIIIRGKVLGIHGGNRGRKLMTIYIRNANTQGRDTYITLNYEDEMLEGIDINDYVEIEAYSLSYKHGRNNENYAQYVICKEIKKIKSEIATVFGIEEGFNYDNLYVRAYFAGEVEKVSNSGENWIVLEIKIPSKNDNENYEYNTVRCQYSRRMRVNDIKPKVGDIICIAAVMTSKRKFTEDEQIITFENFVVDDMAIVGKAVEKTDENMPMQDKDEEVVEDPVLEKVEVVEDKDNNEEERDDFFENF